MGTPAKTSHAQLVRSFQVARPIEEVFQFFSDPRQLEAVTPAWMRFTTAKDSPGVMFEGARVKFRLRLRGIPFTWTSLVTEWNPPFSFTDEQLSGPFRYWKHEHHFSPTTNGTHIEDRITYSVPGGRLINRILVKPDLKRIFDYREAKIRRILEAGK